MFQQVKTCGSVDSPSTKVVIFSQCIEGRGSLIQIPLKESVHDFNGLGGTILCGAIRHRRHVELGVLRIPCLCFKDMCLGPGRVPLLL